MTPRGRRRRPSRGALAAAGAIACGLSLLTAGCGGAAPSASPASPQVLPPPLSAAPSSATAAPAGASAASTPAGAAPGGSAASAAPAPSAWSGLDAAAQLWLQRNMLGVSGDPADPAVLTLCGTGAISVSRDGGATWTSVSTAGVPAALTSTGYALMMVSNSGQPTPACVAAVADPAHAGTVYAEFGAGQAKYGAPPVYYVAVVTTDGGQSWAPVPAPAGFDPGGFGGFAVEPNGAVEAMYGPVVGGASAAAGAGTAASFALTDTTDGGVTWHAASLACPAWGPCVRWGPGPTGTGSCAMQAYPQGIERSADGGRSWVAAYNPAAADLANGCSLGELVALDAHTMALIIPDAGSGAPSVRVSTDGGQTWTPVSLPALPGGQSAVPDGLQLLPDGSLMLAVGGTPHGPMVDLLAPRATNWCAAAGVTLGGANLATLQPVGSNLLWANGNAQGKVTLGSVPLAALHC